MRQNSCQRPYSSVTSPQHSASHRSKYWNLIYKYNYIQIQTQDAHIKYKYTHTHTNKIIHSHTHMLILVKKKVLNKFISSIGNLMK